jgi:anthranilate phosphoribosyltransferase
MSDALLWRAAAALMASHGESAEAEAYRRADAAIDTGDVDGFNRWKRVARFITAMRSKAAGDNVH